MLLADILTMGDILLALAGPLDSIDGMLLADILTMGDMLLAFTMNALGFGLTMENKLVPRRSFSFNDGVLKHPLFLPKRDIFGDFSIEENCAGTSD
jgi:hypothetical protein